MDNKTFRIVLQPLVATLFVLSSCDPFQEDIISPDKQLTINTSATDYYILPGSSTVIDLRSIVTSSFTNATLKVSEYPKRGKLSSVGDLLLRYKTFQDFTQRSDQFKVDFTTEGKVLQSETITIYMVPDTTHFPCSLYAVQDLAYTKPDSVILITALVNDRFCGVDKSNIRLSIYSNPKHGKASVAGDYLSYTSETGFLGTDEVIYKITSENSMGASSGKNILVSLGIISITVGDGHSCDQFTLNNDYVLIADPTRFTFSVTDNDNLCNDNFYVSIVEPPLYGEATIMDDGKILYLTRTYHQDDSLTYKLCLQGECKTASVILKPIRHPDGNLEGTSIVVSWSSAVGIGVSIWEETEPGTGKYEQSRHGGSAYSAGGSTAISFVDTDLPEGKYAVRYDVVSSQNNISQDVIFASSISSSTSTINTIDTWNSFLPPFFGQDTGDLFSGPVQVQYFHKQGNNLDFDAIQGELPEPVDISISLAWDTGNGTPGDVDLDLLLYQDKAPGIANPSVMKEVRSSGSIFESVNTTLTGDHEFPIWIEYKGGTFENLTVTLTLSSLNGIFSNKESFSVKSVKYSIEDLCNANDPPCSKMLIRIGKNGTDLATY